MLIMHCCRYWTVANQPDYLHDEEVAFWDECLWMHSPDLTEELTFHFG